MAYRTCTLAFLAAIACGPAAAVSSSEYDALILRARAGDFEPALDMLRKQHVRPQSPLTHDHILIAGWAEKPAEVISVYQRLPAGSELPRDVLLAVARSYRDTRQWDRAIELFRKGASRFPSHAAFASGEIMTLADAGRLDEALETGRASIQRRPADADLRLAMAYACVQNGQPYDALFHTDKARELAPRNPSVQREYIMALSRARLADSALQYALKQPGLFNDAQMRALQADAMAEQVRMAAMPSRGESQRFAIADRVLARYDELIPAWTALGPAAHDDVIRARIDRLGALHERVRMKDVVREYEALAAEGVEVPGYALSDVAAAYLYERQPEKAGAIYQKISLSPGMERADLAERAINESGLYYSYAESEQFTDANAVVEQSGPRYAPWLYKKGQVDRSPNDLHLDNRRLAANASLLADDTSAAQQAFEDMVRKAPNHTGLRVDLAGVYRTREWPRESERELKMAETLAPRDLAVENGQGFTAMDLQEWRQAEALSRDTVARYPEHLDARRLARDWEVHNKAELRISGYRGLSNDSPVSGSGDFGIDAVLYSKPIDYNWRLFGGGGYASGNFTEGEAHYRYLRAGAEWRGRDLTVEGEVSSHNYGYGTKPGFRLSGAYDLNDHWQVGATGEILSRETPLRALNSDISSNRVEAYARWLANERRQWRLTLGSSRFSDSNQRLDLGLAGIERLYTSPHFKVDGEFLVATQHNSKGNEVPYFNPKSDLTVLPGLRLTHTLYRRYETVWEQIGTVAAGSYSQRDYGTGAVFALGYGQRYRTNDVLDMGFMVTGVSRPYDGNRERELRIVFDLNYRF